MSSIAIMQPYLFPYIGYFQLVDSVDSFVFYDDVNFIKKGWIHRNRIIFQDEAHFVFVSCEKVSQNKLICDTKLSVNENRMHKWIQTCEHAYKKAPFFQQGMRILESCFTSKVNSIGELAAISVQLVSSYLELNTKWIVSSEHKIGLNCGRAERLIENCKHFGANTLINPIAGGFLYNPQLFKEHGIDIRLLQYQLNSYLQTTTNSFIPGLSILDVIMFNSIDEIRTKILPGYSLTKEIQDYVH